MLTTSGTFNDISSSSTLKPYASLCVSPFVTVLTLDVLVTSSCWLLIKSFDLLVTPSFLRVTLTTALPLDFDNPLNEIVFPPSVIKTWSSVSVSVEPSG